MRIESVGISKQPQKNTETNSSITGLTGFKRFMNSSEMQEMH
jgi:hypothetical protein